MVGSRWAIYCSAQTDSPMALALVTIVRVIDHCSHTNMQGPERQSDERRGWVGEY